MHAPRTTSAIGSLTILSMSLAAIWNPAHAQAGGSGPSPEAVEVMAKMGLQLADHESQPLSTQLVRHADLIWTMTRSHRQSIVAQWPEAATRTHVLALDQSDVADPIGGPLEYYRQCAEQIKRLLTERVRQLDL